MVAGVRFLGKLPSLFLNIATGELILTSEHGAGLPVIGAAMRLHELPEFAGWLAGGQRDLELQDPCYAGFLDADWQPLAEQGRALLEAAGYAGRLGIHAAYDGINVATIDDRIRAVFIERYQQSLAFGQALGATHMVIHSPFVYLGQHFVAFGSARDRQGILDNTCATLEPVLRTAQALGCTLVMEGCFDSNPYPLLELVRSFDTEWLRLSLDVGHAFIMQQFGGPTPDQWVLEAGDLLAHVHLQDNDGFADRHWGIGEGDMNWRAFFRALKTLARQPRLVLELNDVAEVWTSMAYLEAKGLAR